MVEKWTCEKANRWYGEKGKMIIGCNYVPADCINDIEMWQEFEFEEKLQGMQKELELASGIGMTSIRLLMPYHVWRLQHDGFLNRFERFLSMAASYNITVMPILFSDCCVPREYCSDEIHFGRQPLPVPGYHGGSPVTPFDGKKEAGYLPGDDRENWPVLERFVKDLVGTFRTDERILLWDIWNEPGNSNRGNMSMNMMENAFLWARQMDPVQPLTAGLWNFPGDFAAKEPGCFRPSQIEQRALELSDVVSFHYYGSTENTEKIIAWLKTFDRPVFITEWLHRILGNEVAQLLPVFVRERVSCYNWGLVAGKSQTYEPWEELKKVPGLDLSRWQHDLFHGDHTPYDEKEIEAFAAAKKACLSESVGI